MKNILVVDDSPVVQHYHINVLKGAGFAAEGAADGMEALEKSLSKPFDLILCDINMPNMDGLTFIRKFREAGMVVPVILISTQEEYAHQKKGYESGANIYIVKPVKPAELIAHAKMLLAGG